MENQESIYQANFYECAGIILQIPFVSEENLESQGDKYITSNYQIGRLKNLTMLLLLSLMEQRSSNDPLIMNMRQILKFDLFKNNIIIAYILYKKETNDYQEDILFNVIYI